MKHLYFFIIWCCFCPFCASVAQANSEIDIFYGCDNGYIIHTGVSIASILKHADKNQNFRFHILTDKSVTQKTRDEFQALQKIKPHFLEFIDVDERQFSDLRQYKGSKGTYYRFIIPAVTGVDKCLYLDGDTIIRGNIQELWNTDLSNAYVGAILDYPEKRVKKAQETLQLRQYFNAGVILFNLKKIREDHLSDQFFTTMARIPNVNGWGDQNVMNYLFGEKIVPLSQKFNWYERFGFNKEAIIAHFIDRKPWRDISSYADEYWRVREETPWAPSQRKIILQNRMDRPQWEEYFIYQTEHEICPEQNKKLSCFHILSKTGKDLLLTGPDNRSEKYRYDDSGVYIYTPY